MNDFENTAKIPREFLPFQPDVVELEHTQVPGGVRSILYTILFLLLAVIVWSIWAKVDRVVSAPGQLIVVDPMIQVKALSTSVIKKVHVQTGERVTKGQTLVTLDPTMAEADLEGLRKKKASLLSHYRRLQAEQTNTEYIPLDDEKAEPKMLQLSLFNNRASKYDAHLKEFLERAQKLESELLKNKQEQKNNRTQLSILAELEQTYDALQRQSLMIRSEYLQAKERHLALISSLDSLGYQEQVLKHEQAEIRASRSAFIANWQQETLSELNNVANQLVDVNRQLKTAEKLNALITLEAPSESVVLDVGEFVPGSVTQAAEPILVLLPVNSELEVLVKVPAKDIGRIRVKDEVRIKLNAFPFQRHGVLLGVVRVISENAFAEKQSNVVSAASYHVRVQIVKSDLKDVPSGYRLIRGMEAVADIKIGTRRVIEYLIYPVIRALGESMREP